MLGDLTGKHAIVTGAGSGIGTGIASVMASLGAYVAIADLNEEAADRISDQISGSTMSLGIDVTKIQNDGKVIFGSTVYLENLDTGEKINYKIVGKDEADLKNKLLYFQSPICKGLIGKNKNDLVEISTPAGIKNFEIKDVKYI